MLDLGLHKPLPQRRSVVEEANSTVSIQAACRFAGVDLPEDLGSRSHKVHCPFGDLYHSDQGVSPAMRVYPDSNSAWCFSCAKFYTPVALAARAWNMHPDRAALRLMERAGVPPTSGRRTWSEVVEAIAVSRPDRTYLAQALTVYCRRICPQWNAVQFEPDVAEKLTRCLALLDLVVTEQDARMWLDGCKKAMLLASRQADALVCQ